MKKPNQSKLMLGFVLGVIVTSLLFVNLMPTPNTYKEIQKQKQIISKTQSAKEIHYRTLYCLQYDITRPYETTIIQFVQGEKVQDGITYISYSYASTTKAEWSGILDLTKSKKIDCSTVVKE